MSAREAIDLAHFASVTGGSEGGGGYLTNFADAERVVLHVTARASRTAVGTGSASKM